MDYCLAIDIAKDKSAVGLFCHDFYNPIIEPYYFKHTLEELDILYNKLANYGIAKIAVIMESTSVYHRPIEEYFRDKNFTVIVINPIISRDHKRTLRKTKTDKEDCYNLAGIYLLKRYNDQSIHEDKFNEMRLMSRYIEIKNKNLIRWKCKLRQLIFLTFPEYEEIYKDESIFTENALNFIKTYPHADIYCL